MEQACRPHFPRLARCAERPALDRSRLRHGAFTEELIAHCAPRTVDAIDPSEGQLTFARTRSSAKLARFRQADAQALPFADKSFDAAAMALVITFVPEPAKAIAEMARVVRPGGLIATYMWDVAGGGLPLAPVGRALKAMGKDYARVSENAARRETMQTLWQQAGLQTVEIQACIARGVRDCRRRRQANTPDAELAIKAVTYPFSRRKSDGVSPKRRRNTRLKCDRSLNPASKAILLIVRSVIRGSKSIR